MKVSGLKKNLYFALGAEGLQLLQSILMSLIIPRILGVEQFGFWQLFIFYTSYGGFFHLGLLDGIYLKIGGKYGNDIDYKSLACQLKFLIIWLFLILLPIAIWGYFNTNTNRTIVIISSCIYIFLYNILSFHSYVLQCINNIKAYSLGRFIDMFTFICGLFVLMFGKSTFFVPYIIVYFIAKLLCLFYFSLCLKTLWHYIFTRLNKSVFKEIFDNIKVGINLLASNIASMLILGIGRWLVDKEWGIQSFSKVSFSLIFVNFFLMFIQQASMVLFPDLRRRDQKQIVSVYSLMVSIIYCIVPFALICYLPFVLIIKYWLPLYGDSINYLVYLLPLCCFETKMQLIYNTMFKVLRMEKKLFLCNAIALFISLMLFLFAVFMLKSLIAVVIAMFIAIFIRSFIAEILIERKLFKNRLSSVCKDIVPELVMVSIFIFIMNNFSLCIGSCMYLFFVILFVVLNHKKYKILIKAKTKV